MESGGEGLADNKQKSGQAALSWPARRAIAQGTAEGLNYLHTDCNPRLIHCDVKADNVLLGSKLEACIADFGLATLMNASVPASAAVRGTVGYLAPEYFATGQMSEKTDVFGFGVFLLELAFGQPAQQLGQLAEKDQLSLHEWVSAADNLMD
eukprot:jgi/Mesen1/7340/ME000377S06553